MVFKLDLTISIVNHNSKDFLRQCLNSIFSASTSLKYQVCVVNNNSDDGSQEMIESCFPDVFLIRNNHNVGFARANNQIIQMAYSRYILVLNPDIIVMQGTLDDMVN